MVEQLCTASTGEIGIPALFHELLDQFDQNWYLSPLFSRMTNWFMLLIMCSFGTGSVMLAFTASSGEIGIPALFHELLDQFDQNWYLSPHFQG